MCRLWLFIAAVALGVAAAAPVQAVDSAGLRARFEALSFPPSSQALKTLAAEAERHPPLRDLGRRLTAFATGPAASSDKLRALREEGICLLAGPCPMSPIPAPDPSGDEFHRPDLAGAEARLSGVARAPAFDASAPAAPPVTLRRQSAPRFSDEVLRRQKRINARLRQHGRRELLEDGLFGPDTERAICELERREGLGAGKGACALETGGALDVAIERDAVSAANRSQMLVQRGDKDKPGQSGARLLQQKLNKINGLPRVAADGDFGAYTWNAIQVFQRRNCLPLTDNLDLETWHALEGASTGNDVSRCPKRAIPPVERQSLALPPGTFGTRPRALKLTPAIAQAIDALPARFDAKKSVLQALIWKEGGMPELGSCNGESACGIAQIQEGTWLYAGCKREGISWHDAVHTIAGGVKCSAIILEMLERVYGAHDPITLSAMYNMGTVGRVAMAQNGMVPPYVETTNHVVQIGYEICYRTGINPLDPKIIPAHMRRHAVFAETVAEGTILQEGGIKKPECRVFPLGK